MLCAVAWGVHCIALFRQVRLKWLALEVSSSANSLVPLSQLHCKQFCISVHVREVVGLLGTKRLLWVSPPWLPPGQSSGRAELKGICDYSAQ